MPLTRPDASPLILDIGCHRGQFLVELAAANPGTRVLGVEKQAARVERTRSKIERLGLSNASVIHAEGLEAVKELPDQSASGIHVLFPDPWPKRRHSIRRLVSPVFLSECLRVMRRGAYLRILTDDMVYASGIRKLAAGFPRLVPHPAVPEVFPQTAFEAKFSQVGRPFETMFWLLDIEAPMP